MQKKNYIKGTSNLTFSKEDKDQDLHQRNRIYKLQFPIRLAVHLFTTIRR